MLCVIFNIVGELILNANLPRFIFGARGRTPASRVPRVLSRLQQKREGDFRDRISSDPNPTLCLTLHCTPATRTPSSLEQIRSCRRCRLVSCRWTPVPRPAAHPPAGRTEAPAVARPAERSARVLCDVHLAAPHLPQFPIPGARRRRRRGLHRGSGGHASGCTTDPIMRRPVWRLNCGLWRAAAPRASSRAVQGSVP